MAFGAGAMISAAAYQLIFEAVAEEQGSYSVVDFGIALGALTSISLAVCGLSIVAAGLGYWLGELIPGATEAWVDAFSAGSYWSC
jgi:hypothetical protein